jgi:hypothetical protein
MTPTRPRGRRLNVSLLNSGSQRCGSREGRSGASDGGSYPQSQTGRVHHMSRRNPRSRFHAQTPTDRRPFSARCSRTPWWGWFRHRSENTALRSSCRHSYRIHPYSRILPSCRRAPEFFRTRVQRTPCRIHGLGLCPLHSLDRHPCCGPSLWPCRIWRRPMSHGRGGWR